MGNRRGRAGCHITLRNALHTLFNISEDSAVLPYISDIVRYNTYRVCSGSHFSADINK